MLGVLGEEFVDALEVMFDGFLEFEVLVVEVFELGEGCVGRLRVWRFFEGISDFQGQEISADEE